MQGIIQLRQGEREAASQAFWQGLKEADQLLQKSTQNCSALETKGLALCGITLCEDEQHLVTAKEAFWAARQICTARGDVTSLMNKFDTLALTDNGTVLAEVRKAIAGK